MIRKSVTQAPVSGHAAILSTTAMLVTACLTLPAWGQMSAQAPDNGLTARQSRPGIFVADPNWLSVPTRSELASLYPEGARAGGVTGRVEVECGIAPTGRLANCAIASETPLGYGFGRATLQIMSRFQAKPVASSEPRNIRLQVTWGPGPDGSSFRVAPPPMIVPSSPSPSRPTTASDRPVIIQNAQWEQLPSGDEFASAYPQGAVAKGVEGRTVMNCAVTEDGHLTECKIVSEAPQGQGFGQAAIAVSKFFKMAPTVNGVPVKGGHIFIPLDWKLS